MNCLNLARKGSLFVMFRKGREPFLAASSATPGFPGDQTISSPLKRGVHYFGPLGPTPLRDSRWSLLNIGIGLAFESCLLITQSLSFSNRHACRYQLRCGVQGSQGFPAIQWIIHPVLLPMGASD